MKSRRKIKSFYIKILLLTIQREYLAIVCFYTLQHRTSIDRYKIQHLLHVHNDGANMIQKEINTILIILAFYTFIEVLYITSHSGDKKKKKNVPQRREFEKKKSHDKY